jgi:ribosomal protein S18 acetylase RimI-like enzyme
MQNPAYGGEVANVNQTDTPTISAPTLPQHPEVNWRPATQSDLGDIWELYRAISLADHPNHVTTKSGLAALFQLSYFDPTADSLLGFTEDGMMVAVGMDLMPTGYTTLARSILVGGVHPEYRQRGIGRVLIEWQMSRARQQLSSVVEEGMPRRIVAFTDERAPQTGRTFEHAGLSLLRYFSVLERSLEEQIPDIRLDDEIRLQPYTPELSEAVHAARDEAFLDNWGSQPMTDEAWEAFVGRDTFRSDLSFAAVATGADGNDVVVGFLLGTVNEADWKNQGFSSSYVSMVGVLEPWRGRRIAKALLSAHLQRARDAGYDRVALDVDSESETGALALYTGMGFNRTHRKLGFALNL